MQSKCNQYSLFAGCITGSINLQIIILSNKTISEHLVTALLESINMVYICIYTMDGTHGS